MEDRECECLTCDPKPRPATTCPAMTIFIDDARLVTRLPTTAAVHATIRNHRRPQRSLAWAIIGPVTAVQMAMLALGHTERPDPPTMATQDRANCMTGFQSGSWRQAYCMRVRRTAAAPKRLECRTVWARASQLYENADRIRWWTGETDL